MEEDGIKNKDEMSEGKYGNEKFAKEKKTFANRKTNVFSSQNGFFVKLKETPLGSPYLSINPLFYYTSHFLFC